MHFELQARLENPGVVTHTVTNFGSIFDGFAVVVQSADGVQTLGRIEYTHHQSPHSQGRSLPVSEHNVERLVFPREWQDPPDRVRVFLEGTLPGSGNDTRLKSNAIVLTIEPPDASP